ncbi:unnamed protein product, partial [Prorocentrum cordatum]
MIEFLAIFINPGAADNYAGYGRRACADLFMETGRWSATWPSGRPPHCCAVLAVAPLLRGKGAGAKLFDRVSPSFLEAVRRMLALLGLKEAARCTLKASGAGKATSLAAAWSPSGVIVAAVEWKSSAFCRYCQADEMSATAVLE